LRSSSEALLAFCHNGWKDGDQLFNNKWIQEEEIPFTIFILNLRQVHLPTKLLVGDYSCYSCFKLIVNCIISSSPAILSRNMFKCVFGFNDCSHKCAVLAEFDTLIFSEVKQCNSSFFRTETFLRKQC